MAFNADEDLLVNPDFWFRKVERHKESIHQGYVEDNTKNFIRDRNRLLKEIEEEDKKLLKEFFD